MCRWLRTYTFIKSKYEDSPSDYSIEKILKNKNLNYVKQSFLKRGSDERQYNSGVDLGITILADQNSMSFQSITHHWIILILFLSNIRTKFQYYERVYRVNSITIYPKTKVICEPFLTKRNLYPEVNIKGRKFKNKTKLILDFLQYSDGKTDITKISKKIKCKYNEAKEIYNYLTKIKLVE